MLHFSVAERAQRRTASASVLSAVERARQRKLDSGQTFWEAMFSGLAAMPDAEVTEILALAYYHNAMDAAATRHQFDFSGAGFTQAIGDLSRVPRGQILALSSLVRLDTGDERHIPMLDYRIPVGRRNQELVCQQLEVMGQTGALFASGQSYHFIGDTLLEGGAEFAAFLGKALLFAPIVDGRWVSHQLIEGACALRLSAGDARQEVPRLVAEL